MKYLMKYILVLLGVLGLSTSWCQTPTWNADGSVTVSGGEMKFSTKVSDNIGLAFKEMVRMNFLQPFMTENDRDPGKGGFRGKFDINPSYLKLSNKGTDGYAQLSIYQYDENATGKKGPLIFGVRASKLGICSEPYTHLLGPGKFFGDNYCESTDIKELIQATKLISDNPTCRNYFLTKPKSNRGYWAGMAFGAAAAAAFVVAEVLTGGAATVVLPEYVAGTAVVMHMAVAPLLAVAGASVGVQYVSNQTAPSKFNKDFPTECFDHIVNQPVIVELTVKNATVSNLRLPVPVTGFDIYTPNDIYRKITIQDITSIDWKTATGNPTMHMDGNSNTEAIVIQTNQTAPATWVDMPDVDMEIWGKMLTHNAGTPAPAIDISYDYGLWVAGEMVSEDFIMLPKASWADHVFGGTHKLSDLTVVESYIKEHGHLPGIPSAAEIKKGYQQHDISRKLLEKIEELTLYKINQHRLTQNSLLELEAQNKRIDEIKAKLSKISTISN